MKRYLVDGTWMTFSLDVENHIALESLFKTVLVCGCTWRPRGTERTPPRWGRSALRWRRTPLTVCVFLLAFHPRDRSADLNWCFRPSFRWILLPTVLSLFGLSELLCYLIFIIRTSSRLVLDFTHISHYTVRFTRVETPGHRCLSNT